MQCHVGSPSARYARPVYSRFPITGTNGKTSCAHLISQASEFHNIPWWRLLDFGVHDDIAFTWRTSLV